MQVFPFIVVAWILGVGLYGVVTSRTWCTRSSA